MNYPAFQDLPGWLQAFLFGVGSMLALPSITDPKKAIRTFQSEAEHFRRGIREFGLFPPASACSDTWMVENFRCWDTEWEIPIAKVNDRPDYAAIQRAW